MVFTKLTIQQLKEWEQFTLNHPNGNFFQSPAAFKFFESVRNHEPFVITVSKNDDLKGVLSGVIIKEPGIKGYFSRRCIVWGGPICKIDDLYGLLIDELNAYLDGKVIYTEFRNLFDISSLDNVFTNAGYEFEDRINYIVEIESVEENKKKLNKTRRWQINKSLKSSVEIVSPKEMSEVREFYKILSKLFKEKVKKPLPELSFFEQFFLMPDTGKYFLVKFEGKIIGGTMCPIFKDTIYEWYKFSLDSEYKNYFLGVMATWAAIEYAANNALKYFDFMGAGKPDEDYGVREFKSKFGGKEVRYGRYIRINNKMLYKFGKMGLKLMGVGKK